MLVKKLPDVVILKANNIIEKRNLLNEIKSSYMTLQEMRFFTIYLSKINPRDISTKEVIFPLTDFLKIMDITRIRIDKLKLTTNRLLSKVINIANEDGGYTGFQLFEKCQVYKDKLTGSWSIKIIAHKESLPLMFDFKEKYFKYELWNALSLTSTNQIRMYEILKQYEKCGERTIELSELKKLLGININQYPRFNSFRQRVLESTKNAIEKYTDIKFEYQPICFQGRKVSKIKFLIHKNKNYINKISLEKFINDKDEPEIIRNEIDEEYELYYDIFNGLFNREQLELLYQLALPIIKANNAYTKSECIEKMANYFTLLYKKLKANTNEIKYPFAYLKKLILVDIEKSALNII